MHSRNKHKGIKSKPPSTKHGANKYKSSRRRKYSDKMEGTPESSKEKDEVKQPKMEAKGNKHINIRKKKYPTFKIDTAKVDKCPIAGPIYKHDKDEKKAPAYSSSSRKRKDKAVDPAPGGMIEDRGGNDTILATEDAPVGPLLAVAQDEKLANEGKVDKKEDAQVQGANVVTPGSSSPNVPVASPGFVESLPNAAGPDGKASNDPGVSPPSPAVNQSTSPSDGKPLITSVYLK